MRKSSILIMFFVGCVPLLEALKPEPPLTVDPKTAPKVMISIPEFKAGEDAISQSFAPRRSTTEEVFIQSFKAAGYPVIESTQDNVFWANPQAMMFENKALQTQGADILVVGQAVSDRPRYERSPNTDWVHVKTPVRIDVKIVKASTGEVLWTDSYQDNNTNSYFGDQKRYDDPNDVFRSSAGQLSARVAKDINAKVNRPAGELFYLTVIYSDAQISQSTLAVFKDTSLQKTAGVSQVKDKEISEYSALFELYYTGNIQGLAEAIGQQKVGVSGLVVDNLSGNHIVARVR